MEEKFGSVYKNFRLGLVRINAEGLVLDKNKMADFLFPFPSRKSSIIEHFDLKTPFSDTLPSEKGASRAIYLTRNGKSCTVIAFREKSGNVLLFLHPVISARLSENGGKGLSKLLAIYSASILEALEAAQTAGNCSKTRTPLIPDAAFYSGSITEPNRSVVRAVDDAVNAISQTVLGKKLTVKVDNRYKTAIGSVSSLAVQYAITELFTLRELFGESERPVLKIMSEQSHLTFVIEDKFRTRDTAGRHFARCFEEMIRFMGFGCIMHTAEDGSFEVKVLVPCFNNTSLPLCKA